MNDTYTLISHLTENTVFITKIYILMLSLFVVKVFRNITQGTGKNAEFLMLKHFVRLASTVL
jgi:hypothetical protein